jgi:uncharacterized membrane protein YheB (UPF0754 family)
MLQKSVRINAVEPMNATVLDSPHAIVLAQIDDENCSICEEISREVAKQIGKLTKGVEKVITEKVTHVEKTVERQVLDKILIHHEKTVKELEKTLKTVIIKDLKNDSRIQELKERLEEVADDSIIKGRIEKLEEGQSSVIERVEKLESEQ